MIDSPLVEWQAPEYEHRERSLDWQWSMGLAGLLLAVIFFYFGNFLFALVILLSVMVIIIYSRRPPQEIIFAITTKGLRAGKELYPFPSIKSFSVTKDNKTLVIDSSRAFLPRIHFPLRPDLSPQVKQQLKRFIKEEEYEERFLDAVADRLGF
jgi:uncharacterized membrane protein